MMVMNVFFACVALPAAETEEHVTNVKSATHACTAHFLVAEQRCVPVCGMKGRGVAVGATPSFP